MLIIKVKFGKDLRRLHFEEHDISWEQLQSELISRFGLEPNTKVAVKYRDSDDDVVSISSDLELQEALSCATQSQNNLTLRFDLSIPGSHSNPLASNSFSSNSFSSNSSKFTETNIVQNQQEQEQEDEDEEEVEERGEEEEKNETSNSALQESNLKDSSEIKEPEKEEEDEEEGEEQVEEEKEQPQEETKEKEHPGIVCNGCKNKIFGIRFKCGHCPDFDFCEKCEMEASSHDPSHVFLKIRTPIHRNSYQWFQKRCLLPTVEPPFTHTQFQSQPQQQCEPLSKKPEFQTKQCEPKLSSLPPNLRPTPVPRKPKSHPHIFLPQTHPSSSLNSPASSGANSPSQNSSSGQLNTHCYDAKFVCDISHPDGTILLPNQHFVKKWKVKNTGLAKWPVGTRLVFDQGDPLGSKGTILASYEPEREAEVVISMTAPSKPGRYTSNWRFVTPEGFKFGSMLWVDVIVQDQSSSSSSNSEESVESRIPPACDNRYDGELKTLLGMGFGNKKQNLVLLKKHSGNVQEVVAEILKEQDNDWYESR